MQPNLLSLASYSLTVGGVISIISAVLALDEERQEQSENKNVQEQLDYLNSEIEKLKK